MPRTPGANAKPYLKVASFLVLGGSMLFGAEQYGLTKFEDGRHMHLDPNLLSVLVLAPIALVLAGIIVFMVGRMRRW